MIFERKFQPGNTFELEERQGKEKPQPQGKKKSLEIRDSNDEFYRVELDKVFWNSLTALRPALAAPSANLPRRVGKRRRALFPAG